MDTAKRGCNQNQLGSSLRDLLPATKVWATIRGACSRRPSITGLRPRKDSTQTRLLMRSALALSIPGASLGRATRTFGLPARDMQRRRPWPSSLMQAAMALEDPCFFDMRQGQMSFRTGGAPMRSFAKS